MVLYILKWTEEAIKRTGWVAWQAHEDMQKVFAELHTVPLNVSMELWGPSPVVSPRIRPGN